MSAGVLLSIAEIAKYNEDGYVIPKFRLSQETL